MLKTQKSKNTKIKNTKVKKYKNTKIKKYKNQKIQKSKNTKIKNTKIKKYKNQKIQKYENCFSAVASGHRFGATFWLLTRSKPLINKVYSTNQTAFQRIQPLFGTHIFF